jgi:hypothetical protein
MVRRSLQWKGPCLISGLGVAIALLGACGGATNSFVGPTPGVAITPDSWLMTPGSQKCFSASGATGPYQWFQSPGLSLVSASGSQGCVTSSTVGTYTLTASSGSTSASASIGVTNETTFQLIGCSVPSGSTVTIKSKISPTCTVNYVSQQPGVFEISMLFPDGSIAASGAAPVSAGSGEVTSTSLVSIRTGDSTQLLIALGYLNSPAGHVFGPVTLSYVIHWVCPAAGC